MAMTTTDGPLSKEQLEQFHNDGYLVVPEVLDGIKEYMETVVKPHLEQYGDLKTLTKFATGDYTEGDEELPGIMIRNSDGSDPLPNDKQQDDCILKNPRLLAILNQLHGNNRNWQWLHPDSVGWIHVRLPVSKNQNYPHYHWHVDGGHFSPHFIDSPEQSVVVLPMLHDVNVGGGNTVVIPQSHHFMAQRLHQTEGRGLDKQYTQDVRHIVEAISKWSSSYYKEVAPCRAGDVLILHPLVIHAAGFATRNQERVTFNLGTRWTNSPKIDGTGNSWLEWSLRQCLSESVPDEK